MGNYMAITCEKEKDFNTNGRELFMNSVRSQINGQFVAIRVKKNTRDSVRSQINGKFVVIRVKEKRDKTLL